jgi:hypothetical protein
MKLRFILQPLMAALLAARDGARDARNDRPPYLRTVLTQRGQRGHLLLEGLGAVATVLMVAVALDIIYQIIAFRRVYPLESLVVGVLLGFVPYLLFRGPANRVARRWFRRKAQRQQPQQPPGLVTR